jgi:hypothetical protein
MTARVDVNVADAAEVVEQIAAIRLHATAVHVALVKFGRHGADCLGGLSGERTRPCTCGLDEAIALNEPAMREVLVKVDQLNTAARKAVDEFGDCSPVDEGLASAMTALREALLP